MCIHPIQVKNNEGDTVTVKCGKCEACRHEKAQQWAAKLICESYYHTKACFITLTFDNKILLDKTSKAAKYGADASFIFHIDNSMKYFQKFIKRLRKHYKDKYISYFHVGEYGEKTKRPHHHAIIYGINFEEDRQEMQISKSGHIQYHSDILEKLWACGRTSIQDCMANNIIYTAQYSLKKFKNNEHNKRYKARMTFSNRCKMNVKFIRRNPEIILKNYIEDKEGKRYGIPKSYKDTLKNSEVGSRYFEIYRKYEENLMEYFDTHSNNDIIEHQKIKAKIRELRAKNMNKIRDI